MVFLVMPIGYGRVHGSFRRGTERFPLDIWSSEKRFLSASSPIPPPVVISGDWFPAHHCFQLPKR